MGAREESSLGLGHHKGLAWELKLGEAGGGGEKDRGRHPGQFKRKELSFEGRGKPFPKHLTSGRRKKEDLTFSSDAMTEVTFAFPRCLVCHCCPTWGKLKTGAPPPPAFAPPEPSPQTCREPASMEAGVSGPHSPAGTVQFPYSSSGHCSCYPG